MTVDLYVEAMKPGLMMLISMVALAACSTSGSPTADDGTCVLSVEAASELLGTTITALDGTVEGEVPEDGCSYLAPDVSLADGDPATEASLFMLPDFKAVFTAAGVEVVSFDEHVRLAEVVAEGEADLTVEQGTTACGVDFVQDSERGRVRNAVLDTSRIVRVSYQGGWVDTATGIALLDLVACQS